MEVSRVRPLRGPNLWSRSTCLEAIVSLSDGELTARRIPGFERGLLVRFPALGPLQPLESEGPLSLAHVLARVALKLQVQAGCPVSFWRVTPTIENGVFQVVVQYTVEQVGVYAFEQAQALCTAVLDERPFDADAVLAELRRIDEQLRLGPSTGSIVRAALDRDIPARRLNEGSLVQLGWGCRQRRILAAETDTTSAIAESIAQDKDLTKILLEAVGVPVPPGRPVKDADDAWAAAEEIGVPVVVKPRYGNQGKGVIVNLKTREEVVAAFANSQAFKAEIMVEKHALGRDFRLLVVCGKLVAAARRDPPKVTGDGKLTVRELVDIVNADPRRGDGHATSLTKIRFDDIAVAELARQGLTAESVPAAGLEVLLRGNGNLSTGGTATDVTDEVHPDTAFRACEAAGVIGLDICGVDVVADRIDQPLEAQGAVVVEVNAAPGLRMHLDPSEGTPRPVGEAIVDSMFEPKHHGRIPLVAVTGTNGKTTTTRLVAHFLATEGRCVGMTCSDGIYVGGRKLDSGDCSGPRSARSVLLNPRVEAAVFETARGGILREGLGWDRCDVAVVTNIGTGDHLGLKFITTVEDLAVVKRVIVQNVTPAGYAVLNAADPLASARADVCPGGVIFFAHDAAQPVLAAHRAKGCRVVFVEGAAIVAAQGDFERRIPLADIPLTQNGRIRFQVENAMAAVGAGWALNLDWEIISRGLATFVSDAATTPGRFNMFDYRGATVIADYGHNPDAVQALVHAVEALPSKKRVVVISGAGDRRDVDIRRQTEILGDAFDVAVLFQDACQRGRPDGEVLALLRQGLVNARRTRDVIEVHGEFLAIDNGLERLEPGDLALVLVDQVEEALAHIAKRCAEANAAIKAAG